MNEVHAAAARWANTWKRGWESLDADPIVALYADGAALSTAPFREPYRGRGGVRTAWNSLPERRDPPEGFGPFA